MAFPGRTHTTARAPWLIFYTMISEAIHYQHVAALKIV
jgi:hypothetical protein